MTPLQINAIYFGDELGSGSAFKLSLKPISLTTWLYPDKLEV